MPYYYFIIYTALWVSVNVMTRMAKMIPLIFHFIKREVLETLPHGKSVNELKLASGFECPLSISPEYECLLPVSSQYECRLLLTSIECLLLLTSI